MSTHAPFAFLVAALTAIVLTPTIRDWAIRRNVLDQALTSRKIHARPVPRLGGTSIVAAFYLAVLVVLLAGSDAGSAVSPRTVGILAGGMIVAALGMVDDLRGLGAGPKLTVQLAAAGLAYALGLRIDVIANPFGADLALGAMGLPVTVLWLVGVTNAMNLVDGIDGLAGGIGVIASAGTLVLSALHGDAATMLVAAALAGASLGFLFYNFSPASVFMGDTGSMFLGYLLAAMAIPAHERSAGSVAMLGPVVALGLPIADTLLAMARRGIKGRPVFQADREHIHHLLLARGWSQRRACLTLYGVAVVLGAAAVLLDRAGGTWVAAAVIGATVVGAAAFLHWVGAARLKRIPEVGELRRRNLELRASVRLLGESLHRSRTPDDVWRALCRFAPALGAQGAALSFHRRNAGDGQTVRYSQGLDDPGLDYRARYGVTPERLADSYLEFGWNGGRSSIDRDTEIAIEQACIHVAGALERMPVPEKPPAPPEGGATAQALRDAVDGQLARVIELRRQA